MFIDECGYGVCFCLIFVVLKMGKEMVCVGKFLGMFLWLFIDWWWSDDGDLFGLCYNGNIEEC